MLRNQSVEEIDRFGQLLWTTYINHAIQVCAERAGGSFRDAEVLFEKEMSIANWERCCKVLLKKEVI